MGAFAPTDDDKVIRLAPGAIPGAANFKPTVQKGGAGTASAGRGPTPMCSTPTCGKPTWNGKPFDFCGKTCKGDQLRFPVGTKIECWMGGIRGWVKGTISDQNYKNAKG